MFPAGLETTILDSKRTQRDATTEIGPIYLLSKESVDGRKKNLCGIITIEIMPEFFCRDRKKPQKVH